MFFSIFFFIHPSQTHAICNSADINLDGIVDLRDYSLLISDFFQTEPTNPGADITRDGIVDLRDYSSLISQFFQECTINLRDIYPNRNIAETHYIEQVTPHQVLWFERQDEFSWRAYNSAPPERCHYDLLSWWEDGFFRYAQTHNGCGSVTNDVTFDPPIIFFPELWRPADGPWSMSDQTTITVKDGDIVTCTGTLSYTSQLTGLERFSGYTTVRFQTNQQTAWDTNPSCAYTTDTFWEEQYFLVSDLPILGTENETEGALLRSLGGNTGINWPQWDILFEYWKPLPSF